MCAHPSAGCIFFGINGNDNGFEKLDCYTHTNPTTTTSGILYLPMCDRQATLSSRVQSTYLRWQTKLAHNVCTIKSLLLRACMRMQSKPSADAIGFHKNLTSDRTPNKSIPIISSSLSLFLSLRSTAAQVSCTVNTNFVISILHVLISTGCSYMIFYLIPVEMAT